MTVKTYVRSSLAVGSRLPPAYWYQLVPRNAWLTDGPLTGSRCGRFPVTLRNLNSRGGAQNLICVRSSKPFRSHSPLGLEVASFDLPDVFDNSWVMTPFPGPMFFDVVIGTEKDDVLPEVDRADDRAVSCFSFAYTVTAAGWSQMMIEDVERIEAIIQNTGTTDLYVQAATQGDNETTRDSYLLRAGGEVTLRTTGAIYMKGVTADTPAVLTAMRRVRTPKSS